MFLDVSLCIRQPILKIMYLNRASNMNIQIVFLLLLQERLLWEKQILVVTYVTKNSLAPQKQNSKCDKYLTIDYDNITYINVGHRSVAFPKILIQFKKQKKQEQEIHPFVLHFEWKLNSNSTFANFTNKPINERQRIREITKSRRNHSNSLEIYWHKKKSVVNRRTLFALSF